MRIAKVVIVTVINAFLAGFFLAQYLGGTGGAAAAPTTWLLLTAAFTFLAIWRVRMIWRAERRAAQSGPPPRAP